ncbi:hypothetical protein HanXRQr2_Chr03g0136961 [Helianthus annuus]|uniref:Uncharacterized protein n=1 Tax=Helianthus annuus TaxID=4232 RepID=A0A251VDJ7_HELAN|nr:hypothetical protein HanXRQr2_Chr03g0136961 [Helianthus annuus]KAJ0945927.1 hypothetical protein HanPSC8_Chr03g0133541 [Helianthus annuus]
MVYIKKIRLKCGKLALRPKNLPGPWPCQSLTKNRPCLRLLQKKKLLGLSSSFTMFTTVLLSSLDVSFVYGDGAFRYGVITCETN